MGSSWRYICAMCGDRIYRSTQVLKCAVCQAPICGQCNRHGICKECATQITPEGKARLKTHKWWAVGSYFLIVGLAAVGFYLMFTFIQNTAPREDGIVQIDGIFLLYLAVTLCFVTVLCYFGQHPFALIEDIQSKLVKKWIRHYLIPAPEIRPPPP